MKSDFYRHRRWCIALSLALSMGAAGGLTTVSTAPAQAANVGTTAQQPLAPAPGQETSQPSSGATPSAEPTTPGASPSQPVAPAPSESAAPGQPNPGQPSPGQPNPAQPSPATHLLATHLLANRLIHLSQLTHNLTPASNLALSQAPQLPRLPLQARPLSHLAQLRLPRRAQTYRISLTPTPKVTG